MQLGIVGLGRMGAGMARRLREGGHEVIDYDIDPQISDVASVRHLVEWLAPPRQVWVMVPHGGPTDQAVDALFDLLDAGDIVVDGGNTGWTDDGPRAARLAERGIHLVDCGVSGGVWVRGCWTSPPRRCATTPTCRGYGCAEDSGAGRWTVEAGIEHAVPTPAISAALYARFASRQDDSPAMKLVAALRREFGGHPPRGRSSRSTTAATCR